MAKYRENLKWVSHWRSQEKGRLVKEIEYYQKFISSVENKLSNEKFANSAPADIVNKERQKLADGQTKLKGLMEALTKLG